MYVSMNYLILSRWAEQLAAKTGKSVERILAGGLEARDFPKQVIDIQFSDGTHRSFERALPLTSSDRPEMAVFSHRDGYHEFPRQNFVVVVKPMAKDEKPARHMRRAA